MFMVQKNKKNASNQFTLISPDFKNNSPIPSKFTCDGANVSPELEWFNPPPRTKSFILIVEDPDASEDKILPWVHWVVYNIPSSTTKLSENIPDNNFMQIASDFGQKKYGGPCPPYGTHRYLFTIYALDTMITLSFKDSTTLDNKRNLIKAMKGHTLGHAQLIGTYQKMK